MAVELPGSVRKFCRTRAFWILVASYIGYITLGSVVLMALEMPRETELREQLRTLRDTFLDSNQCVQGDVLESFIEKVLFAKKYGVSALDERSLESNYDFTSSLFFVSAFLTTTGYGETVPISDGGKLFCIFYCMLGVPLTLLIFACLVQRLMVFVTRRPVHYVHTRWGYAAGRVAVLHALLLGALMITFFFIIPAAIYTAMEGDWSFLESLYFCFISLSTIGLGDYIPGKTRSQAVRQAYEFGTSCYLILGLIGMLLVLETFWELPGIQRFVKIFRSPWETQEGKLTVLPMDDSLSREELAAPAPWEDKNQGEPFYTQSSASYMPDKH
ncbi:potassium channel subfamily K member 1-like [Huso huso]|uniref:Potassium channel subfamily K member n=1 Tax=Huso huso TaxID=61971 RepID=A0ABR0YZF0_HUSHU